MRSKKIAARRRLNPRSSGRALLAVLPAVVWLSCGHTHEATDKPRRSEEPEASGHNGRPREANGGESYGQQDRAERRRRSAAESGPTRPGNERPENPKAAPIASSPEGLLQPGAVPSIHEKLKAAGYLADSEAKEALDGPTRNAIRAFQRDRSLPATGLPDDETVRKLGLEPRAIFRSAGSPKP